MKEKEAKAILEIMDDIKELEQELFETRVKLLNEKLLNKFLILTFIWLIVLVALL
jgi:ribosomal protein L29